MQPRRVPLGAIEQEDGKVIIPESRRADGSVRKEIRIRKGFVPQDEQPVYRPPRGRRERREENPMSIRALPTDKEDADLSRSMEALSIKNKNSAASSHEDDNHTFEVEEKSSDTNHPSSDHRRPLPSAEKDDDGEYVVPSTSPRGDIFVDKDRRTLRKGHEPQAHPHSRRTLSERPSTNRTPPVVEETNGEVPSSSNSNIRGHPQRKRNDERRERPRKTSQEEKETKLERIHAMDRKYYKHIEL
jgi:hypothetical protein